MRGKRAWTIWELRNFTTDDPFTRSFRHLQPIPIRLINKADRTAKLSRGSESRLKAKPARDRIKWWNIVPGDQIRLIADKTSRIREVMSINKIRNRIYLKSDQREGAEQRSQLRKPRALNVDYSKVQLFLGNYDFPSAGESDKPESKPVFALRLGTTPPRFDAGKFIWERFATATNPRLPNWTIGIREHIPIPWPEAKPKYSPQPTPYDTPKDVVAEVTYIPAPVPERLPRRLSKTAENNYILMLRSELDYDQTVPMERYVMRELTNPHSTIKKRARHQVRLQRRKELLKEMEKAEVADLKGRTRHVARLEAKVKWEMRLEADRKEKVARRRKARGDDERLKTKILKKITKKRKEAQRLRNLVLVQAPNQVIPEAALQQHSL